MLLGIAAPLAPGDSFLLTLQFRDAGDVDVAVAVRDGRAAPQRREAE
jgi:copper(I)-binding protein